MSIVALIGSTKYKTRFLEIAKELELEGNNVLHTHLFTHTDGYELTDEQVQTALDNSYERINMADTVYVITPDGKLGDSTKDELEYAKTLKKNIIFDPFEIRLNSIENCTAKSILNIAIAKLKINLNSYSFGYFKKSKVIIEEFDSDNLYTTIAAANELMNKLSCTIKDIIRDSSKDGNINIDILLEIEKIVNEYDSNSNSSAALYSNKYCNYFAYLYTISQLENLTPELLANTIDFTAELLQLIVAN